MCVCVCVCVCKRESEREREREREREQWKEKLCMDWWLFCTDQLGISCIEKSGCSNSLNKVNNRRPESDRYLHCKLNCKCIVLLL